MRKIKQLHDLLTANSELGAKHTSLLKAVEHASELNRSRESQASGLKENDRGDDYWDERLREIGSEVLPAILSYREKNAGAAREGAAGSTQGE